MSRSLAAAQGTCAAGAHSLGELPPRGVQPAPRCGRRGLQVRRVADDLSEALLLDARGLSDPIAEVVELGAPHVAARHNLDLGDDRRVLRERPFHADTEAHFPDRERLAYAAALDADHHALEHLDPLAGAFYDADVDLDGVAGSKVGEGGAQARAADH